MTEFRNVLSNATDAIVNVDQVRVHADPNGVMDKTKSDVFLHFVHPANNTVMEVEDILRTLDYKILELDPFFKEFNVLETQGSAGYLPLLQETSETVIISWLLGVCIFLSLLLLLITCLCVSQRSRYARQLKAVTTESFHAPQGPGNQQQFVPNTNRHALEGSNPVWMSEVGEEWTGNPLSELFPCPHQDSLDTNVLNNNTMVNRAPGLGDRDHEDDDDDGSGFFMTGDVLYRSRDESGSTDRLSNSSGRGSLFASSQYQLSKRDLSRGSPPTTPLAINGIDRGTFSNPRAFSRDLDTD